MPNRFRAALNRLTWPGPGVGLASISDATRSTTHESAGALMVVLIGPRPMGLTLVAAATGAPGWTPNKDTAPPAATSTFLVKLTETS
jgi:hypothetical protein